MSSMFGSRVEKGWIETNTADTAQFVHDVTHSVTKFFVNVLAEQAALDEIKLQNQQKTSQGQNPLSQDERDTIKRKYGDLASRTSNLFTMEIKVLTYNLCTAVLAMNVAFIALGIVYVNVNLVLSLALIAIIREVYSKAVDLETNEVQKLLVDGANFSFKKLDDWFKTGDAKIVIGQKVHGIFRSSAIFTKMTTKDVAVIH
jgi:hypothetical protein